MTKNTPNQLIFLTLIRSAEDANFVRILVESIRSFGGNLSQSPVWIFTTDAVPDVNPVIENTRFLPLHTPENIGHYPFANKVAACAQAEAMAPPNGQTLVWIDPECLVVQPPELFDLAMGFDAAVRPVHIKNVGLSSNEPLDPFWQKVYEVGGLDEAPLTVETFVGQECIHAYFNSHAFAINPAQKLMSRWLNCFTRLVSDPAFQTAVCQDMRHQIFLHQAVLSALLVAELDEQRIHILPPSYNYPYNLHPAVPAARRARTLNELVCFTYEECSLQPETVTDIEIDEPLFTWLHAHFSAS